MKPAHILRTYAFTKGNAKTRPAFRCCGLLALTAFTLAGSRCLVAADYYWDPSNGTTAGTGSATPTATWAGNTARWNTNAAGTGTTVGWSNVAAGSIAVFAAGSDATGSYTVSLSNNRSAGGLRFEEGTVTLTSRILTLTNAATVDVASGLSAAINSTIAGTAGLTKNNAGTLILGATNTYTGLTDVQSGTLALGAGNVFANTSTLKVSGGILSLAANSDTVAGVQLTGGSITGTSGVLTSTTAYDLQAGTVSAILSGAVAVNKTTAGTVILSGNNTYTGETLFGAGIVNVANLTDYGVAGSLGMRAVDTNPPTSNVGLHFTGGTLQYTGSTAQSTNRDIRVGNAGATMDASGTNPSATMSFTKNTANVDVWDSDGARTLTLTGSNTGDNTFAINWQERAAGRSSIIKSGAGTWVLTNPHNSDAQTDAYNTFGGYGGGTTLSGGTLGFANNAIGGGLVNFTGDATLRWEAGNTQDITTGSGAGITRSVGIADGVTATFNTNGNNVTLSNALVPGPLKTGALTKTGAGTLTLSAANTYAGLTTASGGKLTIASTGAINSTSAISIAGGEFNYNSATALSKGVTFSGTGGTLTGSGTITQAVTVTSGNTYSAGEAGAPGTQAFSNGIAFSGGIFSWDLHAATTDPGANIANSGSYDKVTGNGTGSGIFSVVLGSNAFTDTFWDTNKTWSNIFSGSVPLFTLFSGAGLASNGVVSGQGQFSFSGNNLSWSAYSAVPEPSTILAGVLLALGLSRRRR